MSKKSPVIVSLMACGISLGAVATLAQEPVRPQTTPSARADASMERISAGDEAFVRKAAAGGHAEVEMATLALQKASSNSVKQLAQRIEADHRKANAELMTVATSKGVSIDTKPTAEHLREKARIEKLSGTQFDRAYLEVMVKDHQKDIQEFERYATAGGDAALKAFASKTLPDLKEHLKMATDAQKALASSSQHR